MQGWGMGVAALFYTRTSLGFETRDTSLGQHRDNTQRGGGWRSLGLELRAFILEQAIRNSELSKNPGEAPEMLPTALMGNLFANQSCRTLGAQPPSAGY